MTRGRLRIYLGAVAGVGTTYAMAGEAQRRRERGEDVVIGLVQTHGRSRTARQLRDLEVIPPRRVQSGGTAATSDTDSRGSQEYTQVDVDAVIVRRPQVVLIDDLAATNAAAFGNAKRWQDADQLLAAGIDVIGTLNVGHLESLTDVVQAVTGVAPRDRIPDQFVRGADELQLVDVGPDVLRRRLARGDIYPPDRVDAALSNVFRLGNLIALREIALLWLADRVGEALQDYMADHGIEQMWETRERVMVGVSGAPGGRALIRRASRIAMRSRGDIIGVCVWSPEAPHAPEAVELEAQRRLLEELGGRYREVTGDDIGEALLQVARAEQATQIVLGASRRSRWAELVEGSVVNRVTRGAGPIDVHVISSVDPDGDRSRIVLPSRPIRAALPSRRRLLGAAFGVVGLPLLTFALLRAGTGIDLSAALLSYLAFTVLVATVGGIWPSVVVAIAGFVAGTWYFTPPARTWTVYHVQDVLALTVFLATAVVVSALVDLVARRAAEAERARAQSTALARLAATVAASDDPLIRLVEDLRRTFDLDAVAVLRRDGERWHTQACAGAPCPHSPDDGTDSLELDSSSVLVLRGPRTPADHRRVLAAFAAQLALAIDRQTLEAEAVRARGLAEANRLRTSLLSAVSHDLRTPLATIKAWLTGLLDDDVQFDRQATDEIVRAAVSEVDRLNALVGNLLDMSRLQTGGMQVRTRPVELDAVAAAAVDWLGYHSDQVVLELADTLPRVLTDAALLERILVNLIDNAVRHSPPGVPCRVRAGVAGDMMEVHVVDRGAGIPVQQRSAVFEPFQRLDDHTGGIGLGLAVARGLADALSAELAIEDTPAGGATMVLRLKVSA
jgi:two-component system sensor histidine kinase KdpD